MLLFLGQMRASWGQTPCSPKRERIVQATKPRVFLFVCIIVDCFRLLEQFFRAQRVQTTQCVEAGWATEGAPGGATLTT